MEDEERGLKQFDASIDDDAFEYFATQSQGDVRSALNALELAVLSANNQPPHITLQDAKIVYSVGRFK